MKKAFVTARIEKSQLKQLEQIAAKREWSISKVVRKAVEEFVEKERKNDQQH
jgi:predicted transcriptional regulator